MQNAVSLVQALAWPVLIGVALLFFGRELKAVLRNAKGLSVKAGPFEATASMLEAAATIGAATVRQEVASGEPAEADFRKIAAVVHEASSTHASRRLSDATVLWVDDRPANNQYERRALEALGVRFALSTSTDDALEKVRSNRFDAIISDMGRPPDKQAGYTLLEALKKDHRDTPFIIYASSNLPEHRALARKRGALGSTNNPQELAELVVEAITRG